MKIHDIEKTTILEIANIVLTLITDHIIFIASWGELIFGKLNIPPEIQNRVFCLWYGAALDTVIEGEDQVKPLKEQCTKRKLSNNLFLLKQYENLIESIKDRIRKIDNNSQIVLNNLRNTYAHGRVFSVFNKKSVGIKYLDVESDKIVKFQKGSDEFWKIERLTIKSSVDIFLTPLRLMFFDKNEGYFQNLVKLSKPKMVENYRAESYKDLPNVPPVLLIQY